MANNPFGMSDFLLHSIIAVGNLDHVQHDAWAVYTLAKAVREAATARQSVPAVMQFYEAEEAAALEILQHPYPLSKKEKRRIRDKHRASID